MTNHDCRKALLLFWPAVALAVLPTVASAGTLYGATFISGVVNVVEVNPRTGQLSPRVATDATALAGSSTAFDSVGQRFFFGTASDLYVVNLTQGTFSHVPLSLPVIFPMLEFDATTSTLYGATFMSGQVEIVTVDPSSGQVAPRVATDAAALASDSTAFDHVGQRFFFGTASDLYVVNVTQGTFAHVPLSLPVIFPMLEFDTSTSTLYGATFISGQVEVVTIDPSSGQVIPRVVTDATTLAGGSSAFDQMGQRFFFGSDPDLYAVNVAQKSFTHVALSVPVVFPMLQFAIALAPTEAIPAVGPVAMAVLGLAIAVVAVSRIKSMTP